jgi:hypothetical protein
MPAIKNSAALLIGLLSPFFSARKILSKLYAILSTDIRGSEPIGDGI